MAESGSDDFNAELGGGGDDSRENLSQDAQYMAVEYEMVTGLRAPSQLLYIPSEKQIYWKNASSKRGMAYLCNVAGCRIRIYMNNGVCYKLIDAKHGHTNSEMAYKKLNALNEIKTRIIADKEMPIKEIFNDVVARYPDCGLNLQEHLRNFQRIRSAPKKHKDASETDEANEKDDAASEPSVAQPVATPAPAPFSNRPRRNAIAPELPSRSKRKRPSATVNDAEPAPEALESETDETKSLDSQQLQRYVLLMQLQVFDQQRRLFAEEKAYLQSRRIRYDDVIAENKALKIKLAAMEQAVDRLARENRTIESKFERLKSEYLELQQSGGHTGHAGPSVYTPMEPSGHLLDCEPNAHASHANASNYFDSNMPAEDDQFELETKFRIEEIGFDPNDNRNGSGSNSYSHI